MCKNVTYEIDPEISQEVLKLRTLIAVSFNDTFFTDTDVNLTLKSQF